jgi:hypothetical protein
VKESSVDKKPPGIGAVFLFAGIIAHKKGASKMPAPRHSRMPFFIVKV